MKSFSAHRFQIILFLAFLASLVQEGNGLFGSRRRRRRSCGVGQWSSWGECSATTCEKGQMVRTRSPDCGQGATESRECQGPCDCVVSEWVDLGGCTVTCGEGVIYQKREIVDRGNPMGQVCPTLTRTVDCKLETCARDCLVSEWINASGCSTSCGPGVFHQTRDILDKGNAEGLPCPPLMQAVNCQLAECPVFCVGIACAEDFYVFGRVRLSVAVGFVFGLFLCILTFVCRPRPPQVLNIPAGTK